MRQYDMDKDSQPCAWHKQADETDEQYARFLIYRNLGPVRSLDAAYASVKPIAAKRAKARGKNKSPKNANAAAQPRASGQWNKDAAQFNWSERAAKWDVACLLQAGDAVACKYVSTLDVIYRRLLETLGDAAKCRPGTTVWSAVIESFNIISPHIPKDCLTQSGVAVAPIAPAVTRQPTAQPNPGV